MPYRSRLLALSLVAVTSALCCSAFTATISPPLPLSIDEFRRPAEIDTVGAKAMDDPVWAIGRKIFFDPRISASETFSCATCHQPERAWSDQLPRAIGEAHKPLAFRAPTLLNGGHIERYGWTGRFPDVEATAFFAMGASANMNTPLPKLLAKLETDTAYVTAFRSAFPDGKINKQNVGAALTRFVTSIVSDVAPFDHWVAGDKTAISPAAIRGFAIFAGKGKCADCHRGWAFTDGSFHDVGTANGGDIGRGALFKTSVKLKYAFKTPTLRDVATRSPFMHDGSISTLEGVIEHYDKGGVERPSRAIRPLGLSASEKSDLLAFLNTLSGGSKFAVKSD